MRSIAITASWALALLLIVQGFTFKPILFPTRSIEKRIVTQRCMIGDIHKDPDALFEMVQELANTQEFTADDMQRMETIQLALATFVDEASVLLIEQQEAQLIQQPKPPPIPPPGSLIGMEDNGQYQPRDLASDLQKAGQAMELLQERLRIEEEAFAQMHPEYDGYEDANGYSEEVNGYSEPTNEEEYSYNSDEQDILFQAEEALRKSREAAEKRRQEAEQRSLNAAMLSSGYQQLEETDQQEAADYDSYPETVPPNDNFEVPRTQKRPTMELKSLFQATAAKLSSSISSPKGVPVLYNWVQNPDGTISGNIKGSPNFRDGAKISTSCVMEEAQGGMTVATQSGSQYYLEEEEEDYYEESTHTAPDGVPTVKSWEVRSGGGIIGLIYNSPYADDGDYIETSPIVDGDIDNFSVVTTDSGSQYFLSGDPPEDATDKLSNFERIQKSIGTITLPKAIPRSVRSTFSLMDLFEDEEPEVMYLRDGPPMPLHPPTPDKVPPEGTPALTGCVFNDNGTITGYVFGSPKIRDGVLITTSPIVSGNKEQFETVKTASGSMYYLG